MARLTSVGERGLTTSVFLQFKDSLVTPRTVEARSGEAEDAIEDVIEAVREIREVSGLRVE